MCISFPFIFNITWYQSSYGSVKTYIEQTLHTPLFSHFIMASSSASLAPPVSSGLNYQAWVVKMKAYLRGLGVWQYVDEDYAIPQLGANLTLNQIRQYEDELSKALRALSHIHAVVSEDIFT